jgi:rubrerythrin
MRKLIDIDPEQGDDEWQPPVETLVCLNCGLIIESNHEPYYVEYPCPICKKGLVDYKKLIEAEAEEEAD